MKTGHTISSYLISRLQEEGVGHVFGVPGDYVLGLFAELEKSSLGVINTSDEEGAAFAADAYARIRGLGVVCITYCVGGFKVTNATAQAYAEKSPLIVLSGAPGTHERLNDPLLHHKVKTFDTQRKVFEELTAASAVINNAQTAASEIDRVVNTALQQKRPVYLEIPRDMVTVPIPMHESKKMIDFSIPEKVLKEAVDEAASFIQNAERPVILAGIELMRFGLLDRLQTLSEKTNIPVAATILAKSVMKENHPNYMGVYEGVMGREDITDYVESSDCLIMLGTFLTDVNLGICTAKLERGRSVYATSERISIRYHSYDGLTLNAFIDGLIHSNIRSRSWEDVPHPPKIQKKKAIKNQPITVKHLFEKLNSFVKENMVVIADPGDAMFAAIDMTIPRQNAFMSSAYYTSLGFAVPASLGIQTADKNLRPLVLVGDGAFQMSGMELSSIVRFGLNPIVIILNNKGYGTERPMLDGAFNDVLNWQYEKIPKIFNSGKGFKVQFEDELEKALGEAEQYTLGFSIVNVILDPKDISEPLKRLTGMLGKRVQ